MNFYVSSILEGNTV